MIFPHTANLANQDVAFEIINHYPTYSAQRMAHEMHVSGKDVAKTVLIRTHGPNIYVVAVLPANAKIDFEKAASVLSCSKVELAKEEEISDQCGDCELGALPPFGSQYEMQTLIDDSLARDEEILFEGNSHEEAIRMKYKDFERLEKPLHGSFVV